MGDVCNYVGFILCNFLYRKVDICMELPMFTVFFFFFYHV